MDFPISSNVKRKQLRRVIISEGQDEADGPEWLFQKKNGKGY